MKTATAVALAWMAGSLVCGQDAGTKPPPGDSPIPQDKEVVISVIDGASLKVKSNDALIHEGRPLRWVAQGLRDGQSIEIDFEVYRSAYKGMRNVKGPFPRADHPANPYRGRYFLDEKNPRVETAGSDTPGYFKYHVVLRNKSKEDIFALDPGVVVKNDF